MCQISAKDLTGQVNSKFQYSMTKTGLMEWFEVLNLGHWYLFDICYLIFVIWAIPLLHYSITPASLLLSRFNVSFLLRYFFEFIPAGAQGLDDSRPGFPGVDDFMNRVVGCKHFPHGHDAELLLQNA
jgi:hypothetical protein